MGVITLEIYCGQLQHTKCPPPQKWNSQPSPNTHLEHLLEYLLGDTDVEVVHESEDLLHGEGAAVVLVRSLKQVPQPARPHHRAGHAHSVYRERSKGKG